MINALVGLRIDEWMEDIEMDLAEHNESATTINAVADSTTPALSRRRAFQCFIEVPGSPPACV
ncbi:hypothetical protein [Pseudomonas fluorescens]|uniref:hypothetical protein n=1 Tax=Pseudomonas fluorescens TaxID=294 RepID=UPI0002FB30C9